jgi:hypothetical protein
LTVEDRCVERFTIPTPVNKVDVVDDRYRNLDEVLSRLSLYEPIVVDNTGAYDVPADRKKRYNWFEGLSISVK